MRFRLIVAGLLVLCAPARADFQSWSSESEEDPFSGGKKVTINFMSTLRSGVIIFCDTSEAGIEVRAIPGFDYIEQLASITPEAAFAIDGKRLLGATGSTAQVGNNLAAVSIHLDADKAKTFAQAFMNAKKQVAVQDGISDKPHLLTARGSTSAGKSLMSCVEAQ